MFDDFYMYLGCSLLSYTLLKAFYPEALHLLHRAKPFKILEPEFLVRIEPLAALNILEYYPAWRPTFENVVEAIKQLSPFALAMSPMVIDYTPLVQILLTLDVGAAIDLLCQLENLYFGFAIGLQLYFCLWYFMFERSVFHIFYGFMIVKVPAVLLHVLAAELYFLHFVCLAVIALYVLAPVLYVLEVITRVLTYWNSLGLRLRAHLALLRTNPDEWTEATVYWLETRISDRIQYWLWRFRIFKRFLTFVRREFVFAVRWRVLVFLRHLEDWIFVLFFVFIDQVLPLFEDARCLKNIFAC